MDIERIHSFLQNYLDDVVTPKVNKDVDGIHVHLTVYTLRLGTYNPPMLHIFIDVEPRYTLENRLKGVEVDISNFMKIFSMKNKIKIHWNKRPFF